MTQLPRIFADFNDLLSSPRRVWLDTFGALEDLNRQGLELHGSTRTRSDTNPISGFPAEASQLNDDCTGTSKGKGELGLEEFSELGVDERIE